MSVGPGGAEFDALFGEYPNSHAIAAGLGLEL